MLYSILRSSYQIENLSPMLSNGNISILIEQALDRFGKLKSTKGNKITLFRAPKELMDILNEWKKEQRRQLKLFGIKQSEKQFLFTYNNR